MNSYSKTFLPEIKHRQLLINGQWRDASDGPLMDTYDPATGAVISSVAQATAQDVDRAVLAARAALETGPWGKMAAADRGRLLYRLADLIERDIEYIAALDAYNSGKLLIDARDEAGLVVNSLRYYAGWTDKIEGRTIPARGDIFAYTVKQPVGVVGQIIPWNFPLLMLAWKWGPALAAGNTIVMKPAEQTPLSALYLGQLALEAGFPDGVINLVNGPGEIVGDAIVTHPGIDKLAFTGSGATARIIQKRAADTLKRCTFELGGKSPIVVFADADLDQAVEGAFSANFWHAGQCCSAGTRIYVHDEVRPEFVSRLAAKVAKRRLGHQLDTDVTQGPQISQEQSDKIFGYLEAGQREGARLVTGGARHGNEGYFIQPTIFDDVTDNMSIAREEIFGPVASVLGFTDTGTVVDRANDTNFGLAAAVFTKDIDRANRFVQKVKAGFVWVNCYFVLDASLPFGGFKQSGYGRDNGEAALEQYSELKTVVVARS
ncbi:aldehyde dehydrogenase family protein [Sphingobium sp.]|uniref:aldehyde dehydrogenase family protein n=1 Tax=Sphingobium sp. TaxID=1912891 RepID=UPI0028BF2C87|nr:aldehyde dehydrogenase family protein [Sphingobium sp.]